MWAVVSCAVARFEEGARFDCPIGERRLRWQTRSISVVTVCDRNPMEGADVGLDRFLMVLFCVVNQAAVEARFASSGKCVEHAWRCRLAPEQIVLRNGNTGHVFDRAKKYY